MTYEALNNKVIVRPKANVTTLNNNMVIQETRGKKDILVGEVVLSPKQYFDGVFPGKIQSDFKLKPGTLVWYPEFSSLPIMLEGEKLAVIDYEDIYLISKGEETHGE